MTQIARLPAPSPGGDRHKAVGEDTVPTCTVSASLLVMHRLGRWLILRESAGRNRWRLPGGLAQAGECPRQAAARLAREEIGLDLPAFDLLLTSWISGDAGQPGQVVLLFSSRTINDDDLAAMTLQKPVVNSWCLGALDADLPVLPLLAEQLASMKIHGRGHYLEQQHPTAPRPALERTGSP
ncbi:NUDIX domain-containing protein [Nonomuraea endophytica]|uniref:NUDIX domain-containing protein n=1 Tax=Nonomuraea endophytica TaxID=714136 RepID=UPI0037C5619E